MFGHRTAYLCRANLSSVDDAIGNISLSLNKFSDPGLIRSSYNILSQEVIKVPPPVRKYPVEMVWALKQDRFLFVCVTGTTLGKSLSLSEPKCVICKWG